MSRNFDPCYPVFEDRVYERIIKDRSLGQTSQYVQSLLGQDCQQKSLWCSLLSFV